MTRERAILSFLDSLSPVQLHGFHLALDGKTLAEGTFAPFRRDSPHRLFSVSKSAVSLAIGILASDGLLSLDDRICSFFPEYLPGTVPPPLACLTIRNMLEMRTCYAQTTYRPLEDDNWTRTYFAAAPSHLPGTLFNYDTSSSQVLCALAEKLSGQDILSFLRSRLFNRLGMDGDMRWLRDRSGTSQGGTGLVMTLADFARLTGFFLSDGLGVVDAAYLREATSRRTATSLRMAREEQYGYGYQVWQTRRGFSLYGMAGQMGICLPEKKLVLCTLGDTLMSESGVQPIYDAFFEHLAGIDALPSGKDDAKELEARLASLSLPVPETAWREEETLVFRLDTPSLGFDTLTLSPDSVTFAFGSRSFSLPIREGAWAGGAFPVTLTPCFSASAWTGRDTFELHTELTGDWTGPMKLVLIRRGRSASVQVASRIWELTPGWNGTASARLLSP